MEPNWWRRTSGDDERWEAGLDGTTVELGGFWRKPTDVEEHFWGGAEKTGGIGMSERAQKEWRDSFWLMLEELDEKVLAEEVGVWEEDTIFD